MHHLALVYLSFERACIIVHLHLLHLNSPSFHTYLRAHCSESFECAPLTLEVLELGNAIQREREPTNMHIQSFLNLLFN